MTDRRWRVWAYYWTTFSSTSAVTFTLNRLAAPVEVWGFVGFIGFICYVIAAIYFWKYLDRVYP